MAEENKDIKNWAEMMSEAVQRNYSEFWATQLTLIAQAEGVSVKDLCLRHNDITAIHQQMGCDVRFWVEVK